jgi:hypothetical protein
VGRVFSSRVWSSIGVLALAAGMPYCAAALGWAATQDDTTISIRADVAMGVVVSWIGWTILTIVMLLGFLRGLRRRRAVRA